MTPVRGTASHSYPKFKSQVEIFEQWREKAGETRTVEKIVQDLIGEKQ